MITIRRAEPADGPALFNLAHAFATSFVVEEQAFACSFAELRAMPDAYLAVAEAGGELVGYVLGFNHPTLFANGHIAWVEEIMVTETFRRMRIGRQLMAAFEAWAASNDAKMIALATRRAVGFYLALGYEDSAAYFRKRLG